MLNQFVAVGRLVREPETKETESGKRVANITLAVPRSFKNTNGEYDTDFIDITLWGAIAENTTEYCRKGDLVGIKGRVQSVDKTDAEGFKIGRELEIVAEKVTFLATRKEEKDETTND